MLIMAIILMAVLTSVAFAGLHFASSNLLQSENYLAISEARMQTESGISYLSHLLKKTSMTGVTSDQDLMDAVATQISSDLDWSPAMGGGSISYDGSTITIPSITSEGNGSFQATISLVDSGTVQLSVTGSSDSTSRWAALQFQLSAGGSAAFKYGVAAKGPIRMTGNAKIIGANNAEEAECLSATYDTDEAFKLTGNCNIEGGISISNSAGHASLTGNVSVGGDRFSGTIDSETIANDPDAYEAFDIGVGDVEFPEIDPSVFESFAVNEINSSTKTNGNKTFTNVRIKANTNKTFSGNIKFYGVIFIETPNKIHFSGNATITGVIATQDAGDNNYNNNTIKFTGNLTARGVEELPNTPEFSDLRDMPGAFILAPGFSTQFSGNFGTVGGTMAAEEFKWTGNAGGIVRGGVISYGPEEMKLVGNSTITIDRDGMPDETPGFAKNVTFGPVPDSYIEQ